MGSSTSSLKELQDNKYLQTLSGKNFIPPDDPFWNQLLSFTFVPPHNCSDCKLLDDSTKPMLDALLNNNPHTGNVAALVHVFLTRSLELKESLLCENKVFMSQTYNSLFILRSILKYFIETAGEDNMLKQLCCGGMMKNQTEGEGDEAQNTLEQLLNTLVEIIIEVPLGNVTYAIIVEAVNTLLILLSVQMFSTCPAQTSVVYKAVMQGECSARAFLVVKILLTHYVNQDSCPHCVSSSFETGGLVSGIASSIWNILTFSYVRGLSNSHMSCKTVLANQSILLLLALVNHCTDENVMKNPYRDALFSFCDIHDPLSDSNVCPSFRLDYNALYTALCKTLKDDQTTLLTYLLLHKNLYFKQYIITSPDIEAFIVPLLKILYNAQENNSHHIYMALIVLLILSEDEHFDKSIHQIKLKNNSWYSERNFSEITLGSLVVLILTRTIQYNMTRMHDKYLHTNCLAALANMSAHFQNLHSYVCQKFIGLLEIMVKKQVRMASKLKAEEEVSSCADTLSADVAQDISVLEEVIRMLLEILNSCLAAQLKNNTNLIYAMLYNQRVFTNLHSHPCFEDIMQNIHKVIVFFSEHVKAVDQNPSVLEVSEMISVTASEWSKDQLKKFPELKFKYVEEGQPEDFFIPYLWSLVFHSSDIYWNPKNILIFNPHKSI